VLTITPITRVNYPIDIAEVLGPDMPAVIAGVDVALVEPRSAPSGTTTWVASTYATGTATVLVAGYDADPTGALVVPAGQGADLWIRVVDNPEVTATRVMRVIVEPSTADAVVATSPTAGLDALIAALIADPTSAVRAAVLALPTYPGA
jgi:hypothetical protein